MRYKVGDKVVLKRKHDVYGGSNIVRINSKSFSLYFSDQVIGEVFDDKDINHDKTAELQQDKALDHYSGELEKIVEQRNNDDYAKALMKFGRVEGDNLDAIKPANDKYARHKEITDYMHNTYVSKNRDYGDSFRAVHREIGKEASLGQIAHKYNRLKNIILNESTVRVEDETVIDTIIDMANYLVMLAMELEEDGD